MTRRAPRRRISLLLPIFGVAGLAAGLTLCTPRTSTVEAKPAPSPLLFGTNLGLFDANDQFLNDPHTRDLLLSVHVQLIRLPYRTGIPEALVLRAMGLVKDMGLTPIIVIKGPDPVDLDRDVSQLRVIQDVFGDSPVYLDFGNENDLTPEQYTAGWNAVIPTLKQLAPKYQFGGPVSIVYDAEKSAHLLANGRPRPDYIVWHEYTCDRSATAGYCLEAIGRWPVHYQKVRAALIQADPQRGPTIPIFLDEWNYAPNSDPSDGKAGDPAFMREWTARAFDTMASLGVAASAQYIATNHAGFEMVGSDHHLTAQGRAFGRAYDKIINAIPEEEA